MQQRQPETKRVLIQQCNRQVGSGTTENWPKDHTVLGGTCIKWKILFGYVELYNQQMSKDQKANNPGMHKSPQTGGSDFVMLFDGLFMLLK
jgi:hypothetical protein